MACIVNTTGPLVYDCIVDPERSTVTTRFLVFMRECEKNGKRMTYESRNVFSVFIFLLTDDNPIVDKNYDINGDDIKQ